MKIRLCAIILLVLTLPFGLLAQPSIVSQPQSATAVPGATVTFSVTAAGSALSYQWLENYSQLAGQTNSSLVLTDISTNSAARYAVVVSNAPGAVTSSPAILSILTGPPSIQVQPQSQSVWGGTPVTLSVGVVGGGASGSLPAIDSGTLQLWLRADSGVIASSGGQVSLWDDQSGNANDAAQPNTNLQPALVFAAGLGGWPAVRFNGIQDNINGSYLFGPETVNVPNAMTSFTVYDAFSSANTENVIWDIGVPDEFGGNRIDMIDEGDMYFSFWNPGYAAPFIVPTNTYRIRIDQINTNLDTLSMFDLTANGATNFTTSMSGANTPAAGYYLGGLNSSAGPYVGSSRNFDGDIAEIIVYQGMLSYQDRLGVLYYLQQKYYQIDGPGLSFQWLFNGTNLAGATNAFLAFPNVQAEQAGTYSVVASNVYGAVTSSNAVLEVNLIPIILAQPTNQMVIAYQPAAFTVVAEGPSPLPYQWTFDGSNILGATNSALVFSNALPSEAGTYQVILGTVPNVTISSNVVLSLFPSNEIASSLDPGQLNIALQAGGTVTFAVDGTIYLTNTINIATNVILDGANHSITISGSNSVEIFNVSANANFTLRNVTLADGLMVGQSDYYGQTYPAPAYGGAIYSSGNLDVANCTFSNNSVVSPGNFPASADGSSTYGGAIYSTGILLITNTVFVQNSAVGGYGAAEHYETAGSGFGGAIYNNGGTILMGNVTFSNNGAGGGSAYAVIFSGNGGTGAGGAIYSAGGTIAGSNIVCMNNGAGGGGVAGGFNEYYSVNGGSALGGSLYLSGATLSISNVIFSNNACSGGSGLYGSGGSSFGGAVYVSDGTTIICDTSFSNNSATGGFRPNSDGGSAYAGALYITGGSVVVSNSIFSGNSIHGGGGQYDSSLTPCFGGGFFNAGSAVLIDCNFTNNLAQGAIGGQDPQYSPSSPGIGGAIYNSTQLQIHGGSLANNQAVGGLLNESLPPYGPSADGLGGAVYNDGSLEIEGASLSQNSALSPNQGFGNTSGNAWGGAIYNTGFVSLTNTTLSSNSTSGLTNFGEEIYNSGVIQADINSVLNPSVIGTPPLTYQWQISSNNITGATKAQFNLGNVQFGEAGTYSLVISNASGLVTNFPEIINLPPAPLSISSVTPNTGLTLGGTNVTILGTGFTNGASVYFGGTLAASVTVVNATNITAETPAASAAGPVNVTVINGDFQTVVLTNGFTYIAPISLSPQSSGINSNGTFTIDIGGPGLPGYNFTIESSTDLVNWRPLQTNSGPFTFSDTNASSFTLRFYRAVLTQ